DECIEEQVKMRAEGLQAPALGKMFMDRKLITEDDVKLLLKEQEELAKRDGDLIFDDETTRLLPEKFCREKMLVAISREGATMRVAVVDPTVPLLEEEV